VRFFGQCAFRICDLALFCRQCMLLTVNVAGCNWSTATLRSPTLCQLKLIHIRVNMPQMLKIWIAVPTFLCKKKSTAWQNIQYNLKMESVDILVPPTWPHGIIIPNITFWRLKLDTDVSKDLVSSYSGSSSPTSPEGTRPPKRRWPQFEHV